VPGRAGSRQAPLTQLQVDQMWKALNRLRAIVNLPILWWVPDPRGQVSNMFLVGRYSLLVSD
jgi:hypothetical protein